MTCIIIKCIGGKERKRFLNFCWGRTEGSRLKERIYYCQEAFPLQKKIIAAVVGTSAVSAIATAGAADAATTYRVQAGDSLWSIAQRHNTSIANIKSLNNLSSNLIFPNQVLKVAGSANTSSQRTSGGSSVSGGSTYTVQPGDSLSLIASKYGTTYQNIMRLNGLNGFLIHPGQVLKVSGTASNSTTTSNTTRVSGGSVYTVQPGDSLSLIASKYGTTYQNIMSLNGLNNFFIYPGQKLKVTGTTAANTNSPSPSVSTSTGGYYSPVFNHSNLYDWGQCTWHTFNRRAQIGKPISTYWWHAYNWDNAARADGYTVDRNPTVGSILQSDAGYFGHVAFVERINGDGSVLVSEMNFTGNPGYTTYRTIPASQVGYYNFIH